METSHPTGKPDIIVAAGFRGYLLSWTLPSGARILEKQIDALPTSRVKPCSGRLGAFAQTAQMIR